MTWAEIVALAVRLLPCPYCREGPEQPCRTKSGDPYPMTHARRVRPIQSTYWTGYEAGMNQALGFAAYSAERWAQRVERWREKQ